MTTQEAKLLFLQTQEQRIQELRELLAEAVEQRDKALEISAQAIKVAESYQADLKASREEHLRTINSWQESNQAIKSVVRELFHLFGKDFDDGLKAQDESTTAAPVSNQGA